jgi:hypothetical protein
MIKAFKLLADPSYNYQVTLDINLYRFSFKWSVPELAWYLTIEGITDTTVNVNGIKLVGGVDLLEPFGLLDLGELWCVDMTTQRRDPEFDNVATDFLLYYR